MKRIHINVLKRYNSFIAFLIAILGFTTACEKFADEYGPPAPEYGVPSATFIVKGKVESNTNSEAIPGIRVVMGYDTTFSDEKGIYEVENNNFPSDVNFKLEFTDTDGAQNGEYSPHDTIVEFKNPEFTDGDGSWYQGKTEKEVNVKLNKKK